MTKPSWQDYGTYDESAHPDLWDGVVGYWAPCLGPTGTRLHDVSRYNNWGTLTNMDAATDWVIDGGQYALDFDGTNDYTTGTPMPIYGTMNFTLAAWVYIYSTGQGGSDGLFPVMIQKAAPAAAAGCGMIYFYSGANAGKFMLSTGDGASFSEPLTSSAASITNSWAFVVLVRKTGTTNNGTCYVNGVEFPLASSLTVLNVTTTTSFRLAADGSGPFRLGRIIVSDAIGWNRALSQNEVSRLYNLGRGGMLQRRSRRRAYSQQAAFRPHYAQRNAQLIGGGLR